MLRPLTTGELLDRSFTLYRKNFLLFATIVAIPALAVLAVELVPVALSVAGILRPGEIGTIVVGFASTFAALLVQAMSFGVAQGAAVVAVSATYLGRPTRVAECYGLLRGKMWRLIGIAFGTSFLIGIASMLLVVPGILLAVRWSMVIPVAVLEDGSFSVATSRSSDLSSGKGWQIFLIGVLYVVMTYGILMLLYIPILMVIGLMAQSGHAWPALNGLLPLAGFLTKVLVVPFAAIAFSLVYYDARVRKEALDLELLMQSVGAPTPAPAAATAAPGAF
jgi:hypothetical protein